MNDSMKSVVIAIVSLAFLVNVSAGAGPVTAEGTKARKVLLTKRIDEDRELIVSRLDLQLSTVPEVTRPALPVPPKSKLIVPTGIFQVTVALKNRGGEEEVLFSRLVQEYGPLQVGYAPIDVRFVDGAVLLLLSREPLPGISLAVIYTTSGRAKMAMVMKNSWGSLEAAATPVDLTSVDVRLTGAYCDGTLGVSIRDARSEDPERSIEFRWNDARGELEQRKR